MYETFRNFISTLTVRYANAHRCRDYIGKNLKINVKNDKISSVNVYLINTT